MSIPSRRLLPTAAALLLAVSAGLAAPSTARAVQYFTSSTAFQAAVPFVIEQVDFESLPPGTLVSSGTALGGVTLSYAIGSESLQVTDVSDTVSGTRSLGLTGGDNALLDGDEIDLAFSSPNVSAVGLFVITSDVASLQIRLRAGPHLVQSEAPEAVLADGGLVYFLGIAELPSITGIANAASTFSSASIEFFPDGLTNFAYNVDVVTLPEPDGGLLAGVALVALLASRRRRTGGVS